jgi:anti-anti-sigma regulatory factor
MRDVPTTEKTIPANYSIRHDRGPSENDPDVLVLAGDLDIWGAATVNGEFEALTRPVIIDCAAVRFIDASILSAFIRLTKRVAPQRPVLIGVQPHIRRIFAIVKVEHRFTFVERGDSYLPPETPD